MSAGLSMLRGKFVAKDVLRLGRERRLPMFEADLGYFVHCALGELFGDAIPSPFTVEEHDGVLTVLAYTERSLDELTTTAQQRSTAKDAAPVLASLAANAQFAIKPMPSEWKRGARYTYSVLTCPIVRNHSGALSGERSREEDAFLSACRAQNERDGVIASDDRHAPRWKTPVDRASVYGEWLRAQVARHGGDTVLDSVSLTSFTLDRLTRRTTHVDGEPRSKRVAKQSQRPRALLEGTLTVGDPAAFARLVARGVGRHRAFGFGMLLLRPAR